MHPLLVELQRGVRVDRLAAHPAAVRADLQVAPQVLKRRREHGQHYVLLLGCAIPGLRELVQATFHSSFEIKAKIYRFVSFYLHENAHVTKLLVAHAALEAKHLRIGVRLVDVDLDLLLMPAMVINF